MATDQVASILLGLALDAGVLLALAWLADRVMHACSPWRESAWRFALFGAFAVAALQAPFDRPWTMQVAVSDSASTAVMTHPAPVHVVDARRDSAAHDPVIQPRRHAERAAQPRATGHVVPHAAMPVAAPRAPWWPRLLLAGWLAGTLLALARLAFAWAGMERRLREVQPVADPAVARAAATLARAAGVAVPAIGVIDDLASPLAATRLRIVLPRWALDLLDEGALRAMLAHEVAHLARRDPAWKLATAAGCALLWWVPLARCARRRLDEIAELACDAWAARQLGDGRALARCLVECAQQLETGAAGPVLAPAMAHRDSPFMQRIDHLIGRSPMDTRIPRYRAALAGALVLAMAALAIPGFASAPAQPGAAQPPAGEGVHVRVESRSGLFGRSRQSITMELAEGSHVLRSDVRGAIAFTAAEDDVASLADGATATFSETRDGTIRSVEYTGRDGKLERRYTVDGDEHAFDAQARAWLRGFIPAMIREGALDAEARVARIRARGGADAVLDEIARIQSGYARGIYLRHLAAGGTLAPAQVTRALQMVDGIDSDHERRNALAALAAAQPLDPAQQRLLLAQAMKIGSDYERTELLLAMLPRLAPDASLRTAWLAATAGIDSAYEHRRALAALLDHVQLADADLAQVIAAAGTIDSDYERRQLLVQAAGQVGNADGIAASYVDGVGGLDSDYEKREALLALARASGFGRVAAGAALEAAGRIDSDYECSQVLLAVAATMPPDAGLIARYRAVARRLSDTERGAAERALDRFAG